MKKLLFLILVLFGIGIQTARAQCEQPWDAVRIPDFRVFIPNAIDTNTTWTSYNGSAYVNKWIVAVNGDLWIQGNFTKVVQFDPTGTPTQVLLGAKGLAKRDALTGIWSTVPLPGLATGYTRMWYLKDTLYTVVSPISPSLGLMKLNPLTNTWTKVAYIPSPEYINNIHPTGDPHEYWMAYAAQPGNFTGIRRWNTQTGIIVDIPGSNLPDLTSWYTINETQKSDTIFVKIDDIATTNRVLVKGQNTVLDFVDIGITNHPQNGTPNVLNNMSFSSGKDAIVINGEIYACVLNQAFDGVALLRWNQSINQWDSVSAFPHSTNENDVFFYDKIGNTLNVVGFGMIDLATGFFTEVLGVIGIGKVIPDMRYNNNLYCVGGIVKDTLCLPPNTKVPNNVTQLLAGQSVSFMADNGHIGDLAKRYEVIGIDTLLLNSLPIDATNCSNFVFNDTVKEGLQTYLFTLTDTSGNESSPTIITIDGVWPTGTSNVDKDFAFVYTNSKTITAKGDINHVELLSVTGQVIFSSPVNSNQFTQSFSYLPSGMYFLKVSNTSKKQMMVQKITLN